MNMEFDNSCLTLIQDTSGRGSTLMNEMVIDELTLDTKGTIIDAILLPKSVTEYSRKEVIGKSIAILYDQEDRVNKIHEHDLQKAKVRNQLTTLGQRVGNKRRLFWARMDFLSFKSGDGKLMGYRLKVSDIENSSSGNSKSVENTLFSKLPVPTRNGFVFVGLESIIRCESDVNYSIFHLVDGSKVIASRTMRQFENVLASINFLRIHKSHIINLKHIKSYSKASGGVVVMSDNSELSISRTFKSDLVTKLNLNIFE
jgi:DNA-binding LytR/AlgR family response regulator